MDDYKTIFIKLPNDLDNKVELLQAQERLHGDKKTKNDLIVELITEGLKHEKRNAEKL